MTQRLNPIENPVQIVREEQGITIETLALMTGIPIGNIGGIERGRNVSIEVAHKLSAALNTPIEELWPNPFKTKTITTEQIVRTVEKVKIRQVVRQSSTKNKRAR